MVEYSHIKGHPSHDPTPRKTTKLLLPLESAHTRPVRNDDGKEPNLLFRTVSGTTLGTLALPTSDASTLKFPWIGSEHDKHDT
jgi:hypothetical protein